MSLYSYFATAPKGIESVLGNELELLGASHVKTSTAGVSFQGDLKLGYRACLWLRTANRILLTISNFEVDGEAALYRGISQINWSEHLDPEGTLAVDFQSSHSVINNTHYGALKVKDAIVDQFRENYGVRPSVERSTPHLRVNVYLLKDSATVSIDLSGQSLHKRGYRVSGLYAPLKENLAAAILLKGGWTSICQNGGGLIDFMCGSGTLPIEAALIASETAPGLFRDYFGLVGWKKHNRDLWTRLLEEAELKRKNGLRQLTPIVGYDVSAEAITASLKNRENAGLEKHIHFEKKDLSSALPHPRMGDTRGLVVVNPPYGERIGQVNELKNLYRNIGNHLYGNFKGWNALLFTGNEDLSKEIGFSARKVNTLYNGAIKCKLFNYYIKPEWAQKSHQRPKSVIDPASLSEEARMFSNRLKKNVRRLKKWIKSENLTCYRIYDRDIPEFAAAVDVYDKWLHVQEYEAPETVDRDKARSRLNDMMVVLGDIFQVPIGNIFHKVRKRQKGSRQYEKMDAKERFQEISENGNRFLVNLTDYLDTGLFLDHRIIRKNIGELARGKHFLNLFAYTGTATVYAAKGGAKSTTTVDLSSRYLDWARQNLEINNLRTKQHSFEQSDCFKWIKSETRRYDLIFLNPPTFSNIKKQHFTFDIQRDHVDLLKLTGKLLNDAGLLIFSNNYHHFKMDLESLDNFTIENISKKTIPTDFSRNKNIHNCWLVRKKG